MDIRTAKESARCALWQRSQKVYKKINAAATTGEMFANVPDELLHAELRQELTSKKFRYRLTPITDTNGWTKISWGEETNECD